MPINHHKPALWLLCLLFCMPTLGVAMCNTSLGNAGVEPAGLSLFFTPLPALHGAYTGQKMLLPSLEELQNGDHRQLSAGERAFLVASEAPLGKVVRVGAKESKVLGVGKNFSKISDHILKKFGVDAHQLKRDFLGNKAKISQYDLYKDTETGEILILQKGGKGTPIQTGEFIK